MRRLLFALSLVLLVPALVCAQDKAVPKWPDDFEYLGRVTLASPPSSTTNGLPSGNLNFAFGLAVRRLSSGTIDLFTLAWLPPATQGQTLHEFRLPYDGTSLTSASATWIRNLGLTGHPGGIEQHGLFWDEQDQRLYAIGASAYDSVPSVYPVLNRLSIDETTGRLVNEGRWKFDRRLYPFTTSGLTTQPDGTVTSVTGSDKMMNGAVFAVPPDFINTHPAGRLASGGGGYQSAVSIGPASMGETMAQWDPPPAGSSTATPVIARALIGHPFTMRQSSGILRGTRSTNYINDYSNFGGLVGGLPVTTGEDWPRTVSTPPGHWTICDTIAQGMTWVYTPTKSGLVSVEQISEGRCWYGSNDTAHPDGKAAAINSAGTVHQIRIIDPQELGFVNFGGKRQDQVVSTIAPLQLPGIVYPMQGMPTMTQVVVATAFEPISRLFLIEVQDTRFPSTRPLIFVWRVRDTSFPIPGQVTAVTLTE